MTSSQRARPPFRAQFSQTGPLRPRDDERPGCLTAVCLFLLFGVLAFLFLAATYGGSRGKWYPAHLVVQAVGLAAAVLGLWRMQKWGVVALAAVAIGVHILYLFTGLLNVETFLIYAGTLGPALYFYRRMG